MNSSPVGTFFPRAVYVRCPFEISLVKRAVSLNATLSRPTDRKLFYSRPHSVLGMNEESNGTDTKLQQLKNKLDIKDKLDLDEMVGDMGISVPSTNIEEYLRVLRLARKPTREEFTMIAKVSMAGIGIIGTIGFLIYALLTELPKAF